jgi:insertion element IS1 protein InsB
MAFVQVQCPDCHSAEVVQYGKQANGTQRYRCNNRDGSRTIFLLQYHDKGRLPAVKQPIVDMTLNGSGVRDIVRVLRVSSATVIDVLKKKEPAVKQVNERVLHTLDPPHVDVILRQVEAAEMDEMWSFVGSKSQQRWLWHAIDHHTGQILAYVFGTREDKTFLKLKELLAPFGITHYYTDGWGAYRRHIGKYLSGLRKFDHVILLKEGFEAQLRASRPSIPFGMSALGMTRQIRDGCLQCGIQARRVPALQGLNKVA